MDVYIGIGSNVEPERHICAGLHQLEQRFGPLRRSRIYRNAAVGFQGAPFLNLAAGFTTEESLDAILGALGELERFSRRRRNVMRNAPRTLDLDLLLYGGHIMAEGEIYLPRDEILTRAYVLGPLAEIAGEFVHPVAGRRIAELWQAFDRGRHALEEVSLDCHESANRLEIGL